MGLLISALFAFVTSSALPPQVTARLDSASMDMGRIGYLHLQVVLDRGQQLRFPLLEQASQQGLVPYVGDSIELRSSYNRDTVLIGGNRIQVNCHIPMQPFVPGTYMLPTVTVFADSDSALSKPIALKVTGPNVTANDTISPSVGPLSPYYATKMQRAMDSIPDWIYYYWWVIVLAILAIGIIVWVVLRHKGQKMPWTKPKPVIPPYELAIQRLKQLRASGLAENGDEKQYFTELSDILRQYLDGRFDINAQEMTTQQIRTAVSRSREAGAGKQQIEAVLNISDFVKFAKFRALPDDKVAAFENVVKFVELTKPQPKTEGDGGDKNDKSDKPAKA